MTILLFSEILPSRLELGIVLLTCTFRVRLVVLFYLIQLSCVGISLVILNYRHKNHLHSYRHADTMRIFNTH